MKRVGMMLVVLIGLVAMTHEALAQQEVTSVNVVGFKRIDMAGPDGFTQVGMQFDAFDPTLSGVLSTQLISAAKVGNADQVFIWNTSKTMYDIYAMKSDNLFHDANNFGGPATNPPLRSGEGFWIRSAPAAPATRSIVLAGEAVPDDAVTNNIVPGFQMKAFPFSCDVSIQDLDFKNDGATAAAKVGNADKIYLWQSGAYAIFGLKNTDLMWHDANNFGGTAAVTNIQLGQGFWYEAKGTFAWSETNRYSIR